MSRLRARNASVFWLPPQVFSNQIAEHQTKCEWPTPIVGIWNWPSGSERPRVGRDRHVALIDPRSGALNQDAELGADGHPMLNMEQAIAISGLNDHPSARLVWCPVARHFPRFIPFGRSPQRRSDVTSTSRDCFGARCRCQVAAEVLDASAARGLGIDGAGAHPFSPTRHGTRQNPSGSAGLLIVLEARRWGRGPISLLPPPCCEFRGNPAGDSDLMSATVPI